MYRRGLIHRRAMQDGWLAIVAAGTTHIAIAIADDVAEQDVAVVRRHIVDDHGGYGVNACRLPECQQALIWRAPPRCPAVASSA